MRGWLIAPDAACRAALAELDRRLNAPDGAPVAVAVSGGGDSMALLHLASAWAGRRGRPLVVLTVDHGLQPASAEWCDFVKVRAKRLGHAVRTLVWTGPKPSTGLPAAARTARHRLLAEAARGSGARAVLMAHTADDVIEAAAMRRAGGHVPTPAAWSPSPAWPEGRGVFLLRPLLTTPRAALRAMLALLRETWIEDPANDDLRFARARARRELSHESQVAAPCAPSPPSVASASVAGGAAGELSAPRCEFADPRGRRLLGAMALCAGGGDRPPRAERLDLLLARSRGCEVFVATLAGARIEAAAQSVTFFREAGEQRRDGLAEAELPLGESVFDGRFVMNTLQPGWRVRPLQGAAKRLPPAERAMLAATPPSARGALPVVISPAGDYCCPILRQCRSVSAWPLALGRLKATLGGVPDEASLWRVAKTPLGA